MDLSRLMGMAGARGGPAGRPVDQSLPDTSECVTVSSLALIKVRSRAERFNCRHTPRTRFQSNPPTKQMLKHGRAGVPMEVMGLMLGSFVDEYTVRVVDVFAMPQSGTGVSVGTLDFVIVLLSCVRSSAGITFP